MSYRMFPNLLREKHLPEIHFLNVWEFKHKTMIWVFSLWNKTKLDMALFGVFICFIFDKECSRNEISVIKIPLWTLKKKHNSSCHDSLWSPMVKDVFIVVQLVSHVQLFGLQHARFLCPPLSPRVCWNSCVLSLWCCLLITISKMSSRSESRILWLS